MIDINQIFADCGYSPEKIIIEAGGKLQKQAFLPVKEDGEQLESNTDSTNSQNQIGSSGSNNVIYQLINSEVN